MVKLKSAILALTLLFIAGMVTAQEPQEQLTLTLEDCLTKAMENNLGVQIAILDPQLKDIAVAQANEKFIPTLSMSYSRDDTESASYSFLDAGGTLSQLYSRYNFNLTQQIPTGANLSIQMQTYKNESNRNFQTINPRYGATLTFNFSQPLLRDFGFKMAKREIIVARNSLAMSEQDFNRELQNTVYSVEEAYWNLVYAIDNLKVQQQSLQLAEDLLEKNRRSVEVGTMAPIDVISAESNVAQNRASILQASTQVKNAEDQLRLVLNLGAERADAELLNLVPQDQPNYKKSDITLDQALATAMQHRPDLMSSRIGLKNSELDLSYWKNQMLPGLSFDISYWSPGVSGDQILYEGGNALSGVVVGVIPGGISDSLKDAFGFAYQNWSIGLTLDVPLNNIFSRASYAQARVNLDQARLQLQSQEKQLYTDIKIAVRDVETYFQQIEAYQAARELSEKQLEAEEEKLKVGLTENYFVLQYQRDLAQARAQELRAIIDYNLALARLNRDMGVNLDEKNIRTTEMLLR